MPLVSYVKHLQKDTNLLQPATHMGLPAPAVGCLTASSQLVLDRMATITELLVIELPSSFQ